MRAADLRPAAKAERKDWSAMNSTTQSETAKGEEIDARLLNDSVPLSRGPLSAIRLSNDARWPWLILIPRVSGAREWIDLEWPDQTRLLDEINRCSRALQRCFSPDKLNVAALGNVVEQLHVHVIARHKNDPAWPAPVWGRGDALPYPPEQLADRLNLILSALDFD
jgi:diadenosine tetraphosphate (Ap4A) HIT family hydrolase